MLNIINRCKVLSVLLILCMVLSVFIGCASDPESAPQPEQAAPVTQPAEPPAEPPPEPPKEDPAEQDEEAFSVVSNFTLTRRTRETTVPMGPKDTWTIFIYICGTDLETGAGLASLNLELLMRGPKAENVRYIVQTGGTEKWGYILPELAEAFGIDEAATKKLVDPKKLQRWEITDEMILLDELELASMASPQTLADFLIWGVGNYPAEKMGVLMWNHGGGTIQGMFADELFDGDGMSLLEMEHAFDLVFDSMTDKFEFISFDACLMATLETANVLAPHGRYMIASQEIEPGIGWGDYSFFTREIDKNPGMTGAELGTLLCFEYFNLYRQMGMEKIVTLSVIDLEKIDNVIYALNNMALEIKNIFIEPGYFAKASRGAARTESYLANHMVDLGHLAENFKEIAPNSYGDVLRAIEEAVVTSVNGSARAFAQGLSVFYPTNDVTLGYLRLYGLTSPPPDYLAYVSDFLFKKGRFIELGLEPVTVTKEPHVTADGRYSMSIDPTTYDYVQFCGFQLYSDIGDGTSAILGFHEDVDFDGNTGVITDRFDGRWALIDGLPLYLQLNEFTPEYNVYITPISLNGTDTNLLLKRIHNSQDDRYEILGTWSGIDPYSGLGSRSIRTLAVGDRIAPKYILVKTEDVLSEEMVDDLSEYLDGDGNWKLSQSATSIIFLADTQVLHTLLPAGDYFYQFGVIDVFGRQQTYVPISFTIDETGAKITKSN